MLLQYFSDFLALPIMECNKTVLFDRFRQLAHSWEVHILSPTLNKERLDAKVNLQKWLSGHFLIVKLFVMEFREKTKGRKQRRQRAAINLQMLPQGAF